MKTDELVAARLLLASLMDRVEVDAETGKRRLQGTISTPEWKALNVALEALGGTPEPPSEVPDVPKEGARQSRAILSSPALALQEPQDVDVSLCLDFGTAMSKAFASRCKKDGDGFELLELGL